MNMRNSVVLTHDLLAIIFAWVASYLLRFNFAIPPEHVEFMFNNLVFVLLIHISFFIFFRVFLSSWRFSSLNDLVYISFSIASSGLFLVVFFSIFYGFHGIPR